MRFRTKMIWIYISFMFITALILGGWYQSISYKHYEDNAYQNNELLAQQLTNQLDETIKPMEFVSSYLLSDMEVLGAIRILSESVGNNLLLKKLQRDAMITIQSRLQTHYLLTNFRRVIFFNEAGVVVANKNNAETRLDTTVTISDINWIEQFNENQGKPVLLGPHIDDWTLKNAGLVFSSVKKIQGKDLGYIEVQKDYSDLEELIDPIDKKKRIIAVLNNGELLYANYDVESGRLNELKKIQSMEYEGSLNPLNSEELLTYYSSSVTGITFFVIENIESLRLEAKYIVLVSFLIVCIFLIISGSFIFISSSFLSKPIYNLVELMENTQLDNMDMPIEDDTQHNEFKVLNQSYQRLLNRLNESIIQEKRLSLLQLQAQFDLLQTQVNPHFIYNVLNVLSNRGMISGDEKICDMCSSLAHMLRYATNTQESMATIEEEMEYLEEYFYLLKERYVHKIEYFIEIEERIKAQIIPKVFFQQFVENSIRHGFKDMLGTMNIRIRGYEAKGYWYVKISDNGLGFKTNDLELLQTRIHNIHKKIMIDHENIELKIGGMGIVNAYGRMMLFYKEQFVFEFGNNVDGGAFILAGAPIRKESGDLSV